MNYLPSALTRVTVPTVFTPSQIVAAFDCRLRAVLLATEADAGRLPSHPSAERGTVFHRLLDRAARGLIPPDRTPWEAVERELDSLLLEAKTRLVASPATAHFSSLEVTLMPIEWYNTVQKVLEVAECLLLRAPSVSPVSPRRGPSEGRMGLPKGSGQWSEVTVKAPSLRLTGRIDLLARREDGSLVVRDYKTGAVSDQRGVLRTRFERQLRLYALAIQEEEPGAKIELELFDGDCHLVDASSDSLGRAREELTTLLDTLPTGAELECNSLASPGSSCRYCPFRHVCSSYLSVAPKLWASDSSGATLPLDIWGSVTNVRRHGDLYEIDLLDAAGRRVRVSRLDLRHDALISIGVGGTVYCFGLAVPRLSSSRVRNQHPRNFFEIPATPGDKRAWSLALYQH